MKQTKNNMEHAGKLINSIGANPFDWEQAQDTAVYIASEMGLIGEVISQRLIEFAKEVKARSQKGEKVDGSKFLESWIPSFNYARNAIVHFQDAAKNLSRIEKVIDSSAAHTYPSNSLESCSFSVSEIGYFLSELEKSLKHLVRQERHASLSTAHLKGVKRTWSAFKKTWDRLYLYSRSENIPALLKQWKEYEAKARQLAKQWKLNIDSVTESKAGERRRSFFDQPEGKKQKAEQPKSFEGGLGEIRKIGNSYYVYYLGWGTPQVVARFAAGTGSRKVPKGKQQAMAWAKKQGLKIERVVEMSTVDQMIQAVVDGEDPRIILREAIVPTWYDQRWAQNSKTAFSIRNP